MLFNEVRRGKLTTKIQEANPHIQKMVDGLDVHLAVEIAIIRALKTDLFAQADDL